MRVNASRFSLSAGTSPRHDRRRLVMRVIYKINVVIGRPGCNRTNEGFFCTRVEIAASAPFERGGRSPAGRSQFHQPAPGGDHHGFGPAHGVQLGQDSLNVRFDGALTDGERCADLLVALAAGHPLEHFPLAPG
jgi:hypothetical protein